MACQRQLRMDVIKILLSSKGFYKGSFGARLSVRYKVRLCCSFCSLRSINLAELWPEEKEKFSHLC